MPITKTKAKELSAKTGKSEGEILKAAEEKDKNPTKQGKTCPDCGYKIGSKSSVCGVCGAAQPKTKTKASDKGRKKKVSVKSQNKPVEDQDNSLVNLLGRKGIDAQIITRYNKDKDMQEHKLVIPGKAGEIDWVFDTENLTDAQALLDVSGNQATVTVTLDHFLSLLK